MDEKPDEIMNHIEEQRDQLGRNLNELESRVRRTTDWRAQFDRNPMLMMGVALGGGLLLGTIVGGSRKSGTSSTSWSSSPRNYGSSSGVPSSASYTSPSSSSTPSYAYGSPGLQEHRRKTSDTLEMMKAALIGFGTAKVKEFMSEALPGFNQHLEDAQRKHGSSQYDSSQQTSGYQSGSYQSGSQPGAYGGQGSSQYGQQPYSGSQSSGTTQSGGTTRTEQSAQTPYRQEPVGANPARNT